MKTLRFGFAILFLAACAQERLELNQEQVFSKQFSPQQLLAAGDAGDDVILSPRGALRSGSSSRGFGDVSCLGIGCTNNYNNPWAPWINYSNLLHAWNPSVTRSVNLRFGSTYAPPVIAAFDPFAVAIGSQTNPAYTNSCFNLTITADRPIRVTWDYARSYGQVFASGDGTNTVRINAQTNRGNVILALQDQGLSQACPQYGWGGSGGGWGWNPLNWWMFDQSQSYSCGAPQQAAQVRMTGTAGPCGSQQSVNFDLSPYLNTQFGFSGNQFDPYYQYQMPSFSVPVQAPTFIQGSVVEYPGQYGIFSWGI